MKLVAAHLKRYHGEYLAVNDVSLHVEGGEVVGLLGPNGAGKSSTFHILCGLLRPDGGKVSLGKHDITRLPMHRRARLGLGYLPQESSIFQRLTTSENVWLPLVARGDLTQGERRRMLEELLEEHRLLEIRDTLGGRLSGGERRRTEIARALAANPSILLLDEPFAGVDPLAIAHLRESLELLRSRHTGVLITDHNARETLGMCQRAYILTQGRVISEGEIGDILNDDTAREAYLGKDFQL